MGLLTSDLVRARIRQGRIYPRYLDVKDPLWKESAEVLRTLFSSHVGSTLGALEEAIANLIGDDTDFQVRRGLVKLLMDETLTGVKAAQAPSEIRQAVFQAASECWPIVDEESRSQALGKAAHTLGLSLEEVRDGLYADLRSHEVIERVNLPEVPALLARYNLALAQAILLRAQRVVVSLPDARPARARQLFRIAKFHRLMHRIERAEDGQGWQLTLDGPASLFKATQKYGLQLALFLPALCHCERWAMDAEVIWGPRKLELSLKLDHKSGLVSHTKERGTWESEEERHFRASFSKLKTKWKLRRSTRIIDLDGRGVLVPDYVLTHPDGRSALLELVWFWRRRSFESRVEMLRAHGPKKLIIAYATRMNTGRESLPELDGVVGFKGVIQPKRIIEACESFAS